MGDVLRKVEEIAAMADTPCERRGDTLVATYHFHDGRDQTVYIIECGETANGMHMIGFFSPCQKLDPVNQIRFGFKGAQCKSLQPVARILLGFFLTISGVSVVKIQVSGSEALIFPPFPKPGTKRQWICPGLK